MRRQLGMQLGLALLLAALAAGLGAAAPTFPVSRANINNGTVMPISPRWPFPQFLEYNFGKSLANTPPDGMNHAEMEEQTIRAYLEMTKRFSVAGGWKPAALPNRLHYNSTCNCSEGNGYALLAAALMADKNTFDGFWLDVHQWIPEVVSYEIAAATVQNPTYGDGGKCSAGGLQGVWNNVTDNSAADGDVDIALALLIAWKQWGDNSGYTDAGGRPISYKAEFISYTRGMAAFNQNPMIPGRYWGGIIGIDGYMKGGDSFGEMTDWATAAAHPPKYPLASNNCTSSTNCGGENYMSYLAPGYMECFRSEWDSLGDTVMANQFNRAAYSTRDIIRQMNAARTPWSVGTNCFAVDNAGVATFMDDWSNVTEGVRTPMRNALDYLWYGQPAFRWDPVTHEVVAGGPGVNIQRVMASKFSQLMWDPRQAPASNPTFAAATGLSFWGPSQIKVGISLNGNMGATNNHIPVIIGPAAMAACAADDLDAATVAGRQLTLMKNLWRECFLVWDKNGSSYDGSTENKANGFTPAYFHDWFRLQGLITLGGNFHSPCEMVPQANVKIYKSVDKTFAFAGDTLTYWLNLRNYGSVGATSLVVNDVLPAELQYVSSTPAGTAAGQSITWNLGTLAGLQNANVGATLRGITVVAQVRTSTASGTRLCNVATVTLANGPGWTSNEFPNEESMVFKRNCVDIANRALAITKTANVGMATFGDTITYTLQVTSSSSAGWIDGGRPQVIPGFAAQLEGFGPMRMCFSLKSEATEPLIDFGNYRYSFFFEDFLYGGSGGPLTTQSYMVDATHNPSGGRTLADFPPQISQDITGGSDAFGRWNKRYVFQLFSCQPDGCQNEHYTRKYHNNIGLNWQYGDLASPNYAAMDVYPTADQNRPTTLWQTNAWSWMPGMAEVNFGTNPPEPLPVSPDWTDGNPSTPGVFNNLYDTFAVETHTPYDRILVEEWDGYVWRRVFGNGPVPNRDLDLVVATDVLPLELNWGGSAADSDVVGVYTAGNRTVTFNVGKLLTNQVKTLKFWATVKPDGTGGGQFNYGSFPYNSVNSGCAVASNESQVCDDATVQILNVPPPTPTPTPGDLSKSAAPATAASGANVTYNLNYRNTKGSYYMNDATAFTDWTNSGYSSTGGYFYNAGAGTNRVDNNVGLMSGAGPVTMEWDLRGENFQWFGVQFLNNGSDRNGFWIDIFPSDPFNARMNIYRDNVLLAGGALTGIPQPGDFTLKAVFASGNLTLYINGLQIYTVATTLPAGAGTKAGMHNGDHTGAGGSMLHRLYEMRVWSDTALNLRVWDTLPACLTFVSASPAPASAPAVGSTGMVAWNGPLPTGMLGYNQVYSVTVVAKVTGACACGALVNTGLGQPMGIAAQSASAGITVSCGGTATYTPTMSATPSRTPTATPTQTPTPTPSPSATRSASPSPTATATRSASPSYTPSASASASPTVSASFTPTVSPSATRSASPSYTASASPSVTPTATPSASASATPSATLSRTPTPTATASITPSPTWTITFLDTYTVSPTITLTGSSTRTPSASPTASPSGSPSPTPSASPTRSATPTGTGSVTATPTHSPVASATDTPTISPTSTQSPVFSPTNTPTATPTRTASPTFTWSPTATPSVTPSVTPSHTPSLTASPTASASASPSATRTNSATLTGTRTATLSATATPSFTGTRSFTSTATQSATLTVTPTHSWSPSVTPTPSISPTFTVTPTREVQFYQQPELIRERGVYPNPFTERVRLYFTLRVAAEAKLAIYNVAGEPIFTLEHSGKAGNNEIIWEGLNELGARCASGVYILNLRAQGIDGSSGGYWTNVVIMR